MAFTPKESIPYVSKEADPDAYRAWRRAYQREWRRRHNGVKDRGYKFKARYGITVAEFEALVEKQGGVCAICKEPETARWMGTDRIRPLSVDHDHRTGEIRGLLCHSCNRVLGLLNDDPECLRRALAYLEGTEWDS